MGQFFENFVDRFRPAPEPCDGGNNAARLIQQLCPPAISSAGDWDLTALLVACRTLTGDRSSSIQRIHTVVSCARISGGAVPVTEYAELLASRYQLRVHCTLKGSNIRVTFERSVPRE